MRERSRFPFSVSWVGWSIGVYLKYISSISSLVRPPVFLFLFGVVSSTYDLGQNWDI